MEVIKGKNKLTKPDECETLNNRISNHIRFTFNTHKRHLGKGAYGKVDLVQVPTIELLDPRLPHQIHVFQNIYPHTASKLFKSSKKKHKRGKKYLQTFVARKSFRRKRDFLMEIENISRLDENIRKAFFVQVYRVFMVETAYNVIHCPQGKFLESSQPTKVPHSLNNIEYKCPFKSKSIGYFIEMEYLNPRDWILLREKVDLLKNDQYCRQQLLTTVLRQLIDVQLVLYNTTDKYISGTYYDINPQNVFVSNDDIHRIKLIDYGGLFLPSLNIYSIITEPMPVFHSENICDVFSKQISKSKLNYKRYVQYLSNRYFTRLPKRDKYSVIPTMYGIIATVTMCVMLMWGCERRDKVRHILRKIIHSYNPTLILNDVYKSQEIQKNIIELLKTSNIVENLTL